jgi:hypothetical protein
MPLPMPQPPAPGARHDFVRRLGSSRFNYWFGYVANLILIGWLASHARLGGRLALTPTALSLLALSGLLSWTLAEYLLHRFLYHQLPSFLSVGHGLHHASPRSLIGVPWWLTTVVVVGTFLGLRLVWSPAAVGVFMAGNWSGYVLYCLAHHGSHHWHFRNRWLRRMRQHHLIHHAHPQYNWGFTTAIWDRAFGTHRHSGRQRE